MNDVRVDWIGAARWAIELNRIESIDELWGYVATSTGR